MIISLLVLAFCTNAYGFPKAEEIAAEQNGTIIQGVRKSPVLRSGLLKTKCNKDQIICVDDELIFCSPSGYDIREACWINGRKAYCNCEGNGCQASPPTNCEKSTRTCQEPGAKYPLANDCNRFTYCDDNYIQTTIACPSGWVYNPTLRECKPTGDCVTLLCPGFTWIPYYFPFPQSPEYYLFCADGWSDHVSKCSQPGYAAESTGCTFRCIKDGMFQDPKPDKCLQGIYYACSRREDGTFKKEKFQCRPGKYFDNDTNMCGPISTCPQ